ncbi:MAG TPA: hypothetical protein VLH15_07655 [Dehalococcoidales bacterium]|nr:hypothetical protein [Dehalococcoidales bacterium]
MARAKVDKKYFLTELVQSDMVKAPWNPDFTDKEGMRLIAMDDSIMKGAFYMETAWFWPGKWPATKGPEGTVKEHTHPFDEAIAFIGVDPEKPYDLGGEVELWIDGQQNILKKSFIAFIPAGTKHCPLKINKVDRPIFHFTSGMGSNYNLEIEKKAKKITKPKK